jgi:hypothetical protein
MFSIFSKNKHQDEIEKIRAKIYNSAAFKHFSIDNSIVLLEYKKFEATMIACAIYYSKTKHNNSKEVNNKIYSEIKTIYFKMTSTFLREYVLSGILFLDYPTKKLPTENHIIMEVFVKFGRYETDVSFAIEDHKPYFVEDWPGEYEDEIIERKIYFSFISNLFLSQVELNYDNEQYIKTMDDWMLDNEEDDLLLQFAVDFL